MVLGGVFVLLNLLKSLKSIFLSLFNLLRVSPCLVALFVGS